jgi:peptidoglycan hydrolase-like protein with peptidoglycan-binding domain
MESSEFLLGTAPPDSSAATPSPSSTAPAAPVPLPAHPPGLVVGHAEDAAELDADRRADAALGRLARCSTETDEARPDHLRRSPMAGASAIGYDGGPVPDDVAGRIERLRGSGAPLPAATRARMEQGFGTSFAGVRLHVGEEPAELNRLVSAEAFTLGRDVFFGAGRFDPASPGGERMLAHELAHTLQPAAAVRRKPIDLAATPAATNADLTTGDAEWQALHEATLAYSVLAEDMYDTRAAQLAELDRLSLAWAVLARQREQTAQDPSPQQMRHGDRVSALRNLRSLVAVEQRELAAAGVKANERTQRIQAPRFKGDYLLEQVMTGNASLKAGDTGLYVTKVQQALADLNWLKGRRVTGTFGPETEAAVKRYQKKVNLPETGFVNAVTMAKLDARFATHKTEARRAKQLTAPVRTEPGEFAPDMAPPELLDGTRTLSDGDAAAAREAVKTSQLAGPGGVVPTFTDTLPDHTTYKENLTDLVNDIVTEQYQRYGQGKEAQRSNLIGWPHLEQVAQMAKKATDAVFGKYAVGPPLKKGAGLHDAWDEKVTMQQASKQQEFLQAGRRVTKILVSDPRVRELDERHGAIQSRSPEKEIMSAVRLSITDSRRAELLEIDKGWPGFSKEGAIYLQLFKADNGGGNRDKMWALFDTVIHEYLHTLEHSLHKAYQGNLTQQEGSMTLREGVVEYLTFTVRETVKYTPRLRTIVEGEFHDKGVEHPIPPYYGYGERAQAEKLAGVVGARNVMAAFFLGDVEKIGKAR